MRPRRRCFLVSRISGADSARAQEVPRKPASSLQLWLPDSIRCACTVSVGGSGAARRCAHSSERMQLIMLRYGLRFVILLALVSLAACGGGAPAADSPTSGVPTDPLVEAPPPSEPQAAALPELTETVTSENGVTVRYPAGWLDPIATIGVFLYNNADGQSIMNFMRARAGGLAFQINTQPNSTDRTPAELFEFTFSPLATGLGITLSAPETVTIDGVEVLRATGANTNAGSEIGLYVALKPVGEQFITCVVYLSPDEIAAQTPLIEAILATATAG